MLILIVLYVIKVVKRRPIVVLTDAFGKKRDLYQKRVNVVLKVFLGIVFIMYTKAFIVPAALDLPYVVENSYQTFEGYTTSSSTGKRDTSNFSRVFILENNGEEVCVDAYTYRVPVGIYMKVNYLPNTKYATVVFRSDRPNE